MNVYNRIAKQALDEFHNEYKDIKTVLEDGIENESNRQITLSELNDAKEVFKETIETAANEDPNSLDEAIIIARSKFAVAFIPLFRKNGLEEELDDILIVEEEPDCTQESALEPA